VPRLLLVQPQHRLLQPSSPVPLLLQQLLAQHRHSLLQLGSLGGSSLAPVVLQQLLALCGLLSLSSLDRSSPAPLLVQQLLALCNLLLSSNPNRNKRNSPVPL
jgi:hypothetical protein